MGKLTSKIMNQKESDTRKKSLWWWLKVWKKFALVYRCLHCRLLQSSFVVCSFLFCFVSCTTWSKPGGAIILPSRRLHIFLEDTYSDPLLRDDQLLLDFFKFEQRLEIRTRHMEWRIRAEIAEKRKWLESDSSPTSANGRTYM